ncbi:MAG TPA: class I SAM-dependent methyltransferase [Candidatus Limnocylindria bacterium]|nr:class I SAM-dependent methyltransferase [Candidatus Limnocylindria bacterium]
MNVAYAASPAKRHRRFRRVGNRDILPTVIGGALHRSFVDRALRAALGKALWIELKRFSASGVRNLDISRIRGIDKVNVEGAVLRHCPLVLTALARLLECDAIFEFGTYRGDTSWLLAHNLPEARIFTLDLAGPEAVEQAELDVTDPEYFERWDRGARFRGTREASRITQLFGDSATFDFAPFSGKMDLVYIDASHSYSYARSDTEAAFGMLSETGTIVWDDYTHYPGLYAYLNELAPSLDGPIFHLLGTRLALYSRWEIVVPDPQ